MFSSHSHAELLALTEHIAQLVLGPGYEWTDHVLRRAWIDHNLSTVTLRSDTPFHDLLVEEFAHEKWSSGQLFKLVRDALVRAQVDVEEIEQLGVAVRTESDRSAWRRSPSGEWLTRLEAEATVRLRNGAVITQQTSRDRHVPNVMLLAEGLDAQPHEESRRMPPNGWP